MNRRLKIASNVLIFLLIIINCTGCSTSNVWNESDSQKKYLSNNNTIINLNNSSDFSNFKLIDPYLNDHDIFLTGENHAIKVNTTLELEFLKYFTQKAGVKYFLIEASHSYAILFNKYLQTGDESLLKTASDASEGTLSYTKEVYEFWKKIYEYNLTLPEDKKIVVVGPDLEFNPGSVIWSLNYLLPKSQPPKEIKELIDMLKSFKEDGTFNQFKYKEFYVELNESLKTNHNTYEQYLGNSLFDFEFISTNIVNAIDANSTSNYHDLIVYRDLKIYENFLKLIERLPKGKFYGEFGLNHIFQSPQNDVKWFASYLNKKGSQFHNKVLSIGYIYKDCKRINNYNNYAEEILNNYNESDKLLTSFTSNDITLFRLVGDGSPYSKKLLWYMKDFDIKEPQNGVTTDYYQFIVFIKNSEASSVYSK